MTISIKIMVNSEGGTIEIDWGGKIDTRTYNNSTREQDEFERIHKECQESVKILQGVKE